MVILCRVCNEADSKYKCSACFCPYCSVECWKKHKADSSCQAIKVQIVDSSKENNVEKYFTEDTVSPDKLSLLGENATIKRILQNKYLQNTLIAVDKSSNPEEAIRLAMMDQEFVEFVDECLKIVEDPND